MKPQRLDTVSAEKEISFGSLHLLDIKRRALTFLVLQQSIFFSSKGSVFITLVKLQKLVNKKNPRRRRN